MKQENTEGVGTHPPDRRATAGSVKAGAVFSADRRYRYRLWRVWEPSMPTVLFVMFNPSVADEGQDDPTLRRCVGFARSWGFGGISVGNLFPCVATNPRLLLGNRERYGFGNGGHLREMHIASALTICAWGNGTLLRRLGGIPQEELFQDWPLYCLGRTADGSPAHPLYLPRSRRPQAYSWILNTRPDTSCGATESNPAI